MSLDIRMHTWLQGGLSWSYVMSRLAQAFDENGHNTYFTSTNGLKNSDPYLSEERLIKSIIELEKFGPGKKSIYLDLTYTVPQNFPQRFLPNSKHKCAIYNYETFPGWEPSWSKYYHLADFYFPSSNFSAEIFHINGIPKEKIFVIPHGVDRNIFNSNIPPIKLKTKKKFKFVSVVAPHYRKNIDTLLEAYCRAFTSKDDVCLVLKTKVYKHTDGMQSEQNPNGRKPFEVVIGDIFKKIYKKYGKNMPEIELLGGHVKNVASIYNACQAHISTTGAEGYGMIFSESISCGLLNILPNYSGQLDFMNDKNSLLIDTKLRLAKNVEQYWKYTPGSWIGQPDVNHTAELMIKVYKEYDNLVEKFKPEMEKTANKFSWKYAAQLMIDATEGNISHYIPGTYNLKAHERIK